MENYSFTSETDTPLSSILQSKQNFVAKSPYLNFDADFIPKPEFIFPEGASKQRDRFELAFGHVGSIILLGAGVGGVSGLYNGLKQTTLDGQTGKLRRTQLINHAMKQGSAHASTLGVISVMFSGFGVLLSKARGTDDELNTLAAGTATGMLYKSTSGLKRCGISGVVGFSLAALYCLVTSQDKLKGMLQSYSPA